MDDKIVDHECHTESTMDEETLASMEKTTTSTTTESIVVDEGSSEQVGNEEMVSSDPNDETVTNDDDEDDDDDDIDERNVTEVDEVPTLPHEHDHLPQDDEIQDLNDEEDDAAEKERRDCCQKVVVGILLVAFVAFVVTDAFTNQHLKTGMDISLQWIQDNPIAGIFVYILVYTATTILVFPGSVLTLAAGFIFANAFGFGWGIIIGSVAVFIGASLGAIICMLLGRFLLRDWVNELSKRYTVLEALDVAFEEKGFRILVLLRFSPVIPFNVMNYVAGVTAVRFWPYVWALIGMFPGTVFYVFLGASAESLASTAFGETDSIAMTVILVLGIIVGVLAFGLTTYYVKGELNQVIEHKRRERQQEVTSMSSLV